jgi:uncharacterized protein DUF2786
MEGTQMSNFDPTPDTNNQMLNKVRALLMKAQSAAELGNTEEANAYNEKAAQLITKYRVDQAKLADAGEIQDKIISKKITIPSQWAMDKRVLLASITLALGGKMVILSNRRSGTHQSYTYTAHIFAYEGDLERIEFLFDLLSNQMVLGAAAAHIMPWDNKRSFRKSWMAGFSNAIYHRLNRNTQQAAREAGTGTDLVLRNRNKDVERVHDQAYPKLGKPTPRNLNGSGRDQGYAAGMRASLGDNSVGGNSRTALASR